MATAQVLLQRFYYMASLKKYGIVVSPDLRDHYALDIQRESRK